MSRPTLSDEEQKKTGIVLVLCDVCGDRKPKWRISPNCRCLLCPDCKTVPMDSRGTIPGTGVGTYMDSELYQCPKCKRVEKL